MGRNLYTRESSSSLVYLLIVVYLLHLILLVVTNLNSTSSTMDEMRYDDGFSFLFSVFQVFLPILLLLLIW